MCACLHDATFYALNTSCELVVTLMEFHLTEEMLFPFLPRVSHCSYQEGHSVTIEGLCERTEYIDIFFFRPSLSRVLFPMFCLLVEGECQILVF